MPVDSSSFEKLPSDAFLRLSDIARDPKAIGSGSLLPLSYSTVWRKVRDGTFPPPVKLSAGITAWRVNDLRVWMSQPQTSKNTRRVSVSSVKAPKETKS